MDKAKLLAVVLAAGESRRFGSDKRRISYRGKSLLQQSLAKPLQLGLPTLLVLKPSDKDRVDLLLGGLRDHPQLSLLYADDCHLGMGHSLATAAKAAKQHYEGLIVLLADMPELQLDTLRRVCESFHCEQISIPRYQGRQGHPVIFPAAWFDHLSQLSGDRGARSVLEANPGSIQYLDMEDKGIILDMDKPADLPSG